MKFIFISDTHNQHRDLMLPAGDVLIHAGDVSGLGTEKEVLDFIHWFQSLNYKYKIFIAGNHDHYFEKTSITEIDSLIPKEIIYLNDSGTEINGLKIWGSPVQPWFFDWAFNRQRGEAIKKHWDLIPEDTDVLITHGPPYGVLDETFKGQLVGCEDLLEKIQQTKIKYHIFGHIHEAYGMLEKNGVTYINASVLNFKYKLMNAPICIDFS